jgi:hypothetical protein
VKLLLQGCKAFLLGLFVCSLSLAKAHELDAVELLIQQSAPDQYTWGWVAKGLHRSALENIAITWPSTCEAKKNRLQCPNNGLKGKLSLEGLGASVSLVSVRILDGQGEHRYALTQGQPSAWLQSSAAMPSDSGWASHLRVSGTYVALGIEHILMGLDHLLFVISLYLLVGAGLSLIGAITAFTVAHTASLAASALGWVNIPTGPVEACIALSIVLVCAEALGAGKSWTQRAPYLAAFPFGLVHGLGFAGALADIGLPEWHLYSALLSFNLGVEIGQIGIVLLAWWVSAKTAHRPWANAARTALLGLMGCLAAYWSLERIAAIF